MEHRITREETGICRLVLQGPIMAGQRRKLLSLFETLSRECVHTIIVDLKDVPLIDSLGLSALITGYRRFGSDCTRFRLEGVGPQPQLLLQVAGMEYLAARS
jgi:anti-anti-sigma factor